MIIGNTLFEEYDYFVYKFPEPQYFGAKYIHRDWIMNYVPKDAETVLDAFAGSQSIACSLKQLGKKVITNDFLNFNNLIGKALIENPHYVLDRNDMEVLFSENRNPKDFNLIESLYSGLFFMPEDASFADSFRSNDTLRDK